MKKKYFTRGEDAIREALTFMEACLDIGGIPHFRSKYAEFPFRKRVRPEEVLRGIMLVCYGRADYIPSETVFAPIRDPDWRKFVRTVEEYAGDYLVIGETFTEFIPSPEEVEKFLRDLGITPEKAKELAKMPIYARKRWK